MRYGFRGVQSTRHTYHNHRRYIGNYWWGDDWNCNYLMHNTRYKTARFRYTTICFNTKLHTALPRKRKTHILKSQQMFHLAFTSGQQGVSSGYFGDNRQCYPRGWRKWEFWKTLSVVAQGSAWAGILEIIDRITRGIGVSGYFGHNQLLS